MQYRLARPDIILILGTVFLLQLALINQSLPLSELLSAKDILYIDHPFHLYQIELAKALASEHKIVGYDPFFEAGYLGGITTNLSAMSQAVFAWLTSAFLTTSQSYKIYIAAVSLVSPLFIIIACNASGLVRSELLVAGIFSVLMWWASAFRWYFSAGMTASTLAGYFSVLYCILLYRHLTSERALWRQTFCLGLVAALFFFVHPQFPIPVACFVLSMLFFSGFSRTVQHAAPHLAMIGTIALLPNLVWLLPKFGAVSHVVSHHIFQAITTPSVPFTELMGSWRAPSMGSKMYSLLFLSSLWTLAYQKDQHNGQLNLVFIGTWLGLAAFAYFGALLPKISMTEPNRLAPVAYLFLIPVAAQGIITALKCMLQMGPYTKKRYLAAGLMAFTLVPFSWASKETLHEVSYESGGRYGAQPPEIRGPGPITNWILDWIDSNTTNAGRILFETSLARIYDKGHVAGYLALHSGREFIGGPYLENEFVEFWDGHVFKKPIQTIDPAGFKQYMELYNVGWVVVFSPESKAYLDKIQWATRVDSFANINIYSLHRPLSYVVSGCAKSIDRSFNHVTVEPCPGNQQPIILKYHYVQGMKSSGSSKIEPVWEMDDPRPFVKVENYTGSFQLTY
jgi:hypothetical protein